MGAIGYFDRVWALTFPDHVVNQIFNDKEGEGLPLTPDKVNVDLLTLCPLTSEQGQHDMVRVNRHFQVFSNTFDESFGKSRMNRIFSIQLLKGQGSEGSITILGSIRELCPCN